MIVKRIQNKNLRQDIATIILRDLPEWFGIEESTKQYIDTVIKYPFFAVYDGKMPIAFYCVRKENNNVLDLYVLGVLKAYHGQGVGTLLQKHIEEYAKSEDYKYLMVLTLAEKAKNLEYGLTRKFYIKMGFTDFYQNDDIFDKNNPCQILIKGI